MTITATITCFEDPLGSMRYPEGNSPARMIELEISHLIQAEYVDSIPTPERPSLLLGALRDSRLRVISPIKVQFSKENDKVIAEAPELTEFGFGNDRSEALADLQAAIAELFFSLERDKDRLGGDLDQLWSTINEKIVRAYDDQGPRV